MLQFLKQLICAISLCAFISTPSQAMFIQSDWYDPMQPGVGTNRYAYSFNDPINNIDPGGNACLPCAPAALEFAKWAGAALLGAFGLQSAINEAKPNIPASDRLVTRQHNGGPQLPPGAPDPDPVGTTLAALAAAGISISRNEVASLGADPAKGFDSAEALHAGRYQDQFGVQLSRSEHVGADYVIKGTGQTVDAMGPFPSQHFSMKSVSKSLDKHLRKSVDRISIDGTGLTSTQKDALRDNIRGRPEKEQGRIDGIGLD